jgi:hypothetical protein
VIDFAGNFLESVFSNGLGDTLDNLQGAAADKIAELKTAATETWNEAKTDFGGFLLEKMTVALPEMLQTVLLQFTPVKFLKILDLIVDRCGDAGEFLDRLTGSLKAARACGDEAVQTIAGHTAAFVKRIAAGVLGAVLGILVGDLPRQLAKKLKEFIKGIQELVRKLIRKLLEKLKKIFGGGGFVPLPQPGIWRGGRTTGAGVPHKRRDPPVPRGRHLPGAVHVPQHGACGDAAGVRRAASISAARKRRSAARRSSCSARVIRHGGVTGARQLIANGNVWQFPSARLVYCTSARSEPASPALGRKATTVPTTFSDCGS